MYNTYGVAHIITNSIAWASRSRLELAIADQWEFFEKLSVPWIARRGYQALFALVFGLGEMIGTLIQMVGLHCSDLGC